ncbi:MAG: MazG family protein [Eubacteriales bacterium]
MEKLEIVKKKRRDFDDLCAIMDILRGDPGCPWDKEQDHKSIRKNLIEETYEVVEAIDKDDPELLCEELGDLMLQVVFHAKISSESGDFDINDVCDGICRKLIVRHPHIFGETVVGSVGEVLENWETIKKKTKKSRLSAFDGIPPSLPALMRAKKALEKSAGLIKEKTIEEEIGAVTLLAEELKGENDTEKFVTAAAKIIFSVTNILRQKGFDAEEALYREADRFIDAAKAGEKA